MATPQTILYVDCTPDVGIDGMRLAGLRRYASARKWRVETLEHKVCSPEALRDALARLRPIGCAVECCHAETLLRPALFSKVPVVYFDPPVRPAWRNAHAVVCDEAAVARLAFKELSDGNPQSYAVLSCWKTERWARERIDAFRECCHKAGANCQVSFISVSKEKGCRERARPFVEKWAASLPPHCAVFAVNDCCACCAAKAIAATGRSLPRAVTLVSADGAEPPTWDKSLAETISSIRIDFELAGYLAAKMIASAVPPSTIETFPPLLVDRRKSTRGYGRREPRILEAMEIIRRKACDGLTVAKLASRFNGSRRLFEMRFREASGHTALDEIINVRLARAVELLANTDMPIEAVAHFSGFKTTRELWRHVLKQTGMSPMLFRKARK
jgi:LacI family transcriptional regulator